MSDVLKNVVRAHGAKRKTTPQTERTPGRTDEVMNNAGGYVFEVTDKARLERLLILGSAGNTYYVDANAQAADAIDFITKAIAKDEAMVLETVLDVSVNNRALRQTMVLFTLSMLMIHANDKAAVRAVFNQIVRTPTHLFEVCQNIEDLSGWGTSKVKTVAQWFTAKDADSLAYHAVKYRSRSV